MNWLMSAGLCVAGLAAIIIEFFVSAAGLIGLLGAGSIVAGVVGAYTGYGSLVGSIYLISMLIITPSVIALYFRLFPKSLVGRWLILASPDHSAEDFNDPTTESTVGGAAEISTVAESSGSQEETYIGKRLVGKEGRSLSMLRPSGTARIDGRRMSVVTGGEFVDSGVEIVVTRVEGNSVFVRRGAAKS